MKNKNNNILQRTDIKLAQLFAYIGVLTYMLFYGQSFLNILFFHLLFTFIFGLFYIKEGFLKILLFPLLIIFILFEDWRIKRFLKKFNKNEIKEVVVILARSDFYKFRAWTVPMYFIRELKIIVKYIKKKGQDFSFYINAKEKDIKRIMKNKKVKEVYLVGHGDSHTFELNTELLLYYCEFSDFDKYKKDYVHQIHCGTKHGKSLIDYVVPEKNKSDCFYFDRGINSKEIIWEFKKRIANLE